MLSYAYDNPSRITGMSWMLRVNQVGDLEYSYDADGRVIEKTGSLAATGIRSPGPIAIAKSRAHARFLRDSPMVAEIQRRGCGAQSIRTLRQLSTQPFCIINMSRFELS